MPDCLPAAASTTVNLAKVATGLSAAVSHWRFGNIDHRLVLRLAVPGMLGALIGVTILANVDGDDLRPVLAVILLLVGVRIMVRFSRPVIPGPPTNGATAPSFEDTRGVTGRAAAGGVTNGLVGAWGPVVTPFLLHRGLPPRYAIGSVNTAEVAVAIVAAGTLLASLGGGASTSHRVAMLVGGVAAAPLAAWTVRLIPARLLGLAVGALLLVTNVRELAGQINTSADRWIGYAVIAAVAVFAVLRPRLAARRPAAASNHHRRLLRSDASLSENRLNDVNDPIVEPAVGSDHSDVAFEPDTLREVE